MGHTRRTALGGAGGLLAAAGLTAASIARPAKRSDDALSLEQVIANHTRARGGAAALDAVHSEATEIEMTEKGSTIQAHYKCTSDPFFRIDIYDHDKHVFCEGLDADGPWIWPSSEPAAKQGVADGKKTALEGIEFNLYGLHLFPKRGNKLILVGREEIALVNYYVVQVDLKDSYRTFLYIDPQTWLIGRRRDNRAFHPDLDQTKKNIETQYGDYRVVSGVRSAFLQHQVDLESGEIKQVVAVKKLVYNPPIDPSVMSRSYKAD
jgi:hypothetical protein